MKKQTTEDIIEKLAEKEGVQENEIREEMRKAILSAYENSKSRFLWNKLFGEGRMPSPEEFIIKLSGTVVKGMTFSLAEGHSFHKSC